MRGAWWRWWRVPWSDAATAVALLAAAATPVFLVGSAAVWRAGAEDEVARRTVAGAPLDRNGVDLQVESMFTIDGVARADADVRQELARLGTIATPVLSVYTLLGLAQTGPPTRTIGPSARLFAQDGALDAVTVVDELPDTTGGVWITEWFAEQHGLELGDALSFEAGAIADEEWNDLVQGGGARSGFRIVGFYEPIWSSDPAVEPDPYWTNKAPPEVVPSFISAFNGPNTELAITDRATLLASGLTGVARWRAPLTGLPETYDALRSVRDGVRRFELSALGTGELGDALGSIATDANRRPLLATDLYETVGEVERSALRLVSPLGAVRSVGIAIGLVIVLTAGWFVVDRRRSEYRLLASEGDGAARIAARSAMQLTTPVVAGAGLGVLASVTGPAVLGSARWFDTAALSWTAVAGVAAMTLAVASLTVGFTGSRALRGAGNVTARRVLPVAMAVLAAASVFLWLQLGRTDTDGVTTVDLSVVTLPVVGLLLAVSIAVWIATWLLGRFGRRAAALPDVAYLAIRRFSTGTLAMQLVAAAVGLGVGLVVFSSALTSTLDRTVDVKLATRVGGESSVTLTGPPPVGLDLPDGTAVVRTFDTIVTPGRVRTRLVAVDPDTFAEAITWPAEFGEPIDRVLADLDGPADESIPVIAIAGEVALDGGAIGVTQTWPYRVVRRVGSLPFAGETAMTLVVDGEQLDQLALTEAGYASVQEANASNYLVPTQRFRVRLVTQAPLDELLASLDAADVQYRDPLSRAELRRSPDLLASRAAFGFLRVLGLVAAVAALAALALYLDARRRARAVGNVMTRTMGLSDAAAAWVTSIEVGVVVAIATVAGLVTAPPVIRRLSRRFDPAPDLPPDVAIATDWVVAGGVAVVGLVVVMIAVWVFERRSAGRSMSEVVRGDG